MNKKEFPILSLDVNEFYFRVSLHMITSIHDFALFQIINFFTFEII